MAGVTGKNRQGFGDGLATAGQAIIADARKALNDPQLSNAEAVHDLRKALKRWRALMRLLIGPIGDPADQMRREARTLMQELAGARDAQAALDALADLSKGKVTVSSTSLKTIHRRLTELRDAAEKTGFTPEMRERLTQYLDAAALALEQWPLREIGFTAIADALAATYRRARQLMPENWQACEPEQLHDLRRRVVEHRHQMDLIEPLWPRLGQLWAEEAQRLRNQLGACQDIAMLTNLMAPHQPVAPWRSRLTPAIEARRAAHLNNASRLASRLFAEKPKAFRTRIAALWTARRQSNQ